MRRTEDARTAFGGQIDCAQSWEDPVVLLAGLRVGPEDDVLSICASGDNCFALAIAGARSVTAIDLSAPQIALAKLKLMAAKRLDVERFRSFLGVGSIGQRVFLYHELRSDLDDQTRSFWDEHEHWIREGLIGCGIFERHLGTFRTRLLPLIHRRRTIDAFMDTPSLQAQRRFYTEHWDGWRWRAMVRMLFSQAVMNRAGLLAPQRRRMDGPNRHTFLARTHHAFTEIPLRTNPFLQWMLLGSYRNVENGHPYLSQEGHAALADAADSIRFVHGDLLGHLKRCAPGTYTAFNLSTVPDYLSEEATTDLLNACVCASGSGARLAYWNLLVDRHRPEHMADVLDRHQDRAADLLRIDRAFVYGGLQLETVR